MASDLIQDWRIKGNIFDGAKIVETVRVSVKAEFNFDSPLQQQGASFSLDHPAVSGYFDSLMNYPK